MADNSTKSPRTLILNALKGLVAEQFKEFTDYLSDKELGKLGMKPIPRGLLENKDRMDIANLLISRYTEQEALKITYKVLKAKNFEDEALQFEEEVSGNRYALFSQR